VTVERRSGIGSWLEGPAILNEPPTGTSYRGERLGLPETGTNSLASLGRRLGALCVDWFLSYLIATGLFGAKPTRISGQLDVLAVFVAEYLLLLSTLGFTIGMRIFQIRVARLGSTLNPLVVIIRTVLLCLVVPAAVFDRDYRGLHEKLTRTVVVNR
jgi:uncharacterized RDD family membrane protein YckC